MDGPDAAWVPLDAAARGLGISPDAARKRIERGTLRGEKQDGRWLVRLDPVAGPDAAGRRPTGHEDATRTPPDATPDAPRGLVDHLLAENAYLREQLAERSRELAAERERFDVIHREALVRIEALTAGETAIQEPHSASPTRPGAAQATERAPDASSPSGGAQRPWWRRLLGIRG